eukprot:CAMPEP_0171274580 /NCGR_PEP_ID=MMETSP0790-20130122/62884_1 /TAXON_ID=2925 /ORGANISM="Alexandrium catenella, Strain OF101" /LENGTH=130 /DNA_ID=CAMNT_0011743625 /DNA_START=56 /DNA_END=445 /DNA_ORIENTATION=-
MSYVGEELEWESRTQMKRAEAAIRTLEDAANWEELQKLLEDNWCAIRGSCFHKFSDVASFQKKNRTWIKLDTEKVDYHNLKGSKVLRIVDSDSRERSLDLTLKSAGKAAEAHSERNGFLQGLRQENEDQG